MSFGKPVKENGAAEARSLEILLRERLDVGESLDALINELGFQYGRLSGIDTAIGRMLFERDGVGKNPLWLSETANAELLRNRLAMELAEHSSGAANQTILGPVKYRESLVQTIKTQNGGIAAKGGEDNA